MIKQRRSDELSRSQIRAFGEHDPRVPPMRTASFDTARIQQRGGQSYVASFPDVLPVDMSPLADGSETSSTPGGVQPSLSQAQTFAPMSTPVIASNSTLYKLDAMMFPTDDPFAYPNQQPLMDFPAHSPQAPPSGSHGGDTPGGQQGDSMQFYIPTLYDDIEGQLLGPIPSYMPQHQGQGQYGLGINTQMHPVHGMMGMGPGPATAHGQPYGPGHGLTPQQRQRQVDAMLSDPNFRGDWGDILGNGSFRQG